MIYEPIIALIEKPVSGEWGNEPLKDPIVRVIRNTNFTNEGRLNLSNVVERSISQERINLKSLKQGDIIIEKSGGSPNQPVGRVVYYDQNDGEYLFSNFTSALRTKGNVHSKYLFYILLGHHKYCTTLSYQNKTTGIINLQLTRYLEETKVPVPPLETQKKIAEILDKADELRRNDKKILEKYDQLAQRVFLEMFGDPVRNEKKWKKTPLGLLVRNENSKRVPVKQSIRDLKDEVYPYFGATGQIDMIDDYKFNGDYLLIAEDGKNLLYRSKNNAFMVSGKFWVNNHAHVLSYNGSVVLRYLEFILNAYDLKPYVTGIDQFKLNRENLDKIPIPVPDLSLQNKFSKIVEQIMKQKELSIQSLKESEKLFQSLLQRAFRGDL